MSMMTAKRNLNLNVRGLKLSATLAINELSNRLQHEGRKVYRLGLGQSPFPVPEVVVEALREHAHEKDYLPVRGLPELKETVAAYYQRTREVPRAAEHVLIGPGSKELMFLLQLVYQGELVIPTPSWVSYAPQAHIIGRNVRWLPTDAAHRWCLTAQELDRFCREDTECPRLIILNYPGNPSGCTYNEDELRDLAAVARKHELILLSDEIYGELHFEGEHVSIARFYPEGVIISGGLSKWCGAGGWRLGTFLFPESLSWLLNAMAVVASETYSSTCAPIQYAAIRAFSGGPAIDSYLDRVRAVLKKVGMHLYHLLMEAGLVINAPEGAYYLFPDFEPFRESLARHGITTSIALAQRLLEEAGVALLPGTSFGRPPHELTVRLAFVNFDGSTAITAAEQGISEDFVYRYCADTVAAVQALCDWLKAAC